MPNKSNLKKNKHLTMDDRKEIEDCLSKRMSFKSIAALIEKDPTTISYEVKHHRKEYRNGNTSTEDPCPLLLKAPFVCNGCSKRMYCHFVHFYYRAAPAFQEYKSLLTDAREGTPLNKEEFYQADRIITSGIQKGQHIYHILANAPGISCSKSTVYRHMQKGYYSVSRIDLPRAVKFKPRRQKPPLYVPAGVKVGRTYEDFLAFMEERHLDCHVELDTVIGREGGKVILTIHFTSVNFMIGLLLENKTSLEAAAHFCALKGRLRAAGVSVCDLMVVLLADNGGEFADVFSYENDPDGNRELPMFFCDPMQSSQKPFIEKNHTLFRDIVPSGSSFDDFTQDTVNLIFSHVNSVSRFKYGGKTSYDMFSFLYGSQLPALLGISKVDPECVVQSPLLLKGIADLKKNL